MSQTSDWFSSWRRTLDFDRIDYGAGGIELFKREEILQAQLGYAVTPDGESLVGVGPGDWRPEWMVIGCETACGDPIFVSQIEPHPVFTAMHGEGSWEPSLVAPSTGMFRDCLEAFRLFAHGKENPVELEKNPSSEQERTQFIKNIRQITGDHEEAWMFWAVQIDVDPEVYAG